MTRFGICGAGTMGASIACAALQAGFRVFLYDTSEAARSRGITFIRDTFAKAVEKEKMSTSAAEEAIKHLTSCSTLKELSVCEIVIEAIVEDKSVKHSLFTQLEALLPPNAIIASNTSSIAITTLALGLKRPERFIGMHFFNPVPMMKLCEIICGIATTEDTFAFTEELATSIGKTTVCVQDYPGFISNRILMPMINEAIYCVMENIATIEDIDSVMKLGMNHPMGPLTLADFIGLDTCLAIMQVLHEGLGDSKYRPCPLLKKMVAAGYLGKKVGRGFYKY